MISMPSPSLAIGEVFDVCMAGANESDRKLRIQSVRQSVLDHADEYHSRANPNRLDQIGIDFCPDELTSGSDLTWIYTNRLVPTSCGGRVVYDSIQASAVANTCPLCGLRQVDTVDHYLPKERYPMLSVTPENLIPACRVCNTHKAAKYPNSSKELFIHPYFDAIDKHRWLQAVVIEDVSKVLVFSISEIEEWGEVMRIRIAHHMHHLKLNELFLFEANTLLLGMKHLLNELHEDGGFNAVKDHLIGQEQSIRKVHLNSCRAVAYSAWANSDWFCDLGFNSL